MTFYRKGWKKELALERLKNNFNKKTKYIKIERNVKNNKFKIYWSTIGLMDINTSSRVMKELKVAIRVVRQLNKKMEQK